MAYALRNTYKLDTLFYDEITAFSCQFIDNLISFKRLMKICLPFKRFCFNPTWPNTIFVLMMLLLYCLPSYEIKTEERKCEKTVAVWFSILITTFRHLLLFCYFLTCFKVIIFMLNLFQDVFPTTNFFCQSSQKPTTDIFFSHI